MDIGDFVSAEPRNDGDDMWRLEYVVVEDFVRDATYNLTCSAWPCDLDNDGIDGFYSIIFSN